MIPDLVRLDVTDSTNAALRRLADQGAPHATAVLADHQTAGKGRLGRTWLATPGDAVLLSVLIRRSIPAERVPLLALATAVAGAEAISGLGIKWPNDLLAPDGRKVAGILAEAEFRAGFLDHAILGIGVNVTGSPELPTAASLREAFPDAAFDREALAAALHRGIVDLAELVGRDPAAVLERWRARAHTLGKRVRIGEVEGVAVDVDRDGALLVDTPTGRSRVLAGDVAMVSALDGR